MFSTTNQTSLLISNLHCPSCITTIERNLNALNLTSFSISQSLASHTVIINHSKEIPVTLICHTLESAGFQLDSVVADSRSPEADLFSDVNLEDGSDSRQTKSRWPLSFLRRSNTSTSQEKRLRRKRHLETCDLCQRKELQANEANCSFSKNSPDDELVRPLSLISASPFSKAEAEVEWKVPQSHDLALAPLTSVTTGHSQTEDVTEVQLSISGMTCSACVATISQAFREKDWIQSQSITVNLVGNCASARILGQHEAQELVDLIDDLGYEAAVQDVTLINGKQDDTHIGAHAGESLWKASWAIQGMTCSACINAINTALKDISWIKSVDINLVGNSATTVFNGQAHLDDVRKAIEDLGYEAKLGNLEEVKTKVTETVHRRAGFKITGMYCERCPTRIAEALKHLKGDYIVENMPTMDNPIFYVDYVLSRPTLTIRAIVDCISAADAALGVSVYHSPTMEERSRKIHIREQKLILARVILALVIAIPTFIIGIVYMNLVPSSNTTRMFLMDQERGVARAEWILLALATPVYFFAADLFHRRTLKELRALWRPGSPVPFARRFLRFGSMNMLVSLGTSIAYWSSIGILIASAVTLKPTSALNKEFYFDSVVFLTLFLLLGRLMEAYSKAKTGDAVAMLGKLRPESALLVTEEIDESKKDKTITTIKSTSVDFLELGDILRVQHGSSPPLDGRIVDGKTTLDESSLTGESKPVSKTVGDTVYSGTINTGPAISIEVTGIEGKSMLDQIIKVVRESQARRAPVERLADFITGHFVPAVTFISLVTWVTWLALGFGGALPNDYLDTPLGGWPYWSLQFAIAVFVVACPCGIGLAAPTALFVGGGLAAKHGILVKGGGEAFQEASKVDIVVFDKTGTLTLGGEPKVTDEKFLLGDQDLELSRLELLGMVKRLEEDSGHPVAKAVVAWCGLQEFSNVTLEQSNEVVGKGMYGRFTSPTSPSTTIDILIGNLALLHDHVVHISPSATSTLHNWTTAAKSLVLIAARTNKKATTTSTANTYHLVTMLAVSDPLRPEAPFVISTLRSKYNIAVWMLTGDNAATAVAVGAQLGIPAENIIAGVLPAEKAGKIRWLQRSQPTSSRRQHRRGFISKLPRVLGRRDGSRGNHRAVVAMVGDGTNDAPALSTADVSIAISHTSGSDIAMSTASFVLLTPSLLSLLTLLDLSRAVVRRIIFNFGWALVYNCIGLPVAAGVLYPLTSDNGTHIRLDPVWAALAMALSSVSVVGSSLALRMEVPLIGFKARKVQ